MKITSIILARGGSKGIPKKNLINFCGKPLIYWTIKQCLDGGIDSNDVYVSSDDEDILSFAKSLDVNTIVRTPEVSQDISSSEESWIYSINELSKRGLNYDWIIAPQVTSPLRDSVDIKNAIGLIKSDTHDCFFSAVPSEDICVWNNSKGYLDSANYDWKNRKRRQDNSRQYVENGSFYIFKPKNLLQHENRFHGNIGVIEMDQWKLFEIDSLVDLKICSLIMENFIL